MVVADKDARLRGVVARWRRCSAAPRGSERALVYYRNRLVAVLDYNGTIASGTRVRKSPRRGKQGLESGDSLLKVAVLKDAHRGTRAIKN